MAQRTPTNPFAGFYEAQSVATAEIVQAALNGMQRLQQLTLQAMRTGAGNQFSLAQAITGIRESKDVNRAVADAAAPAAEQSARYQRELLQVISDMNNEVVRASYSMMERMRDAFAEAAPGAISMPSAMAGFAHGGDSLTNPMALYDSEMRQWQTAVQQMTDAPSASMSAAAKTRGEPDRPSAARGPSRPAKRKSGARKRT
ncbi:MAG: phasin family protein [Burkholderiaceae bacterium]